MNISDIITTRAANQPNSPALLLEHKTISNSELDYLCWQCVALFSEYKIVSGQTVGLSIRDEYILIIVMIALARLGVTIVSIPNGAPDILKVERATLTRTDCILTDDATLNRSTFRTIVITLELITSKIPISPSPYCPSPKSPLFLVFGSGSTGNPKIFPITHRQFQSRLDITIRSICISHSDSLISLVHLDYITAKDRLFSILAAGGSYTLFKRSTTPFIPDFGVDQPNILNASVFHLESIIRNGPADQLSRLKKFRAITTSGSTVSMSLRMRICKYNRNLYIWYGANECGIATVCVPNELFRHTGTIGRPCIGAQIEIVSDHGLPIPIGQIGNVRIKTSGMISHYFEDHVSTGKMFRDTWFYPGDLCKATPDGHIIYCGRSDHMMIMNGINIYPAEIESVITKHPAIRDAAAVPFSHPIHQDVPVCAVSLHSNKQVSARDLYIFAQQRLGASTPRSIVILDDIPRNEQGKLQRSALLEQLRKYLSYESKPQHAQPRK